MINFKPIVYVLGLMLCTLSAAMMFPVGVDIFQGNDDWTTFLGASMLTVFFGVAFLAVSMEERAFNLDVRQAFLLTVMSWTLLPMFASTPFLALGLAPADAFFEAMSGLTTTGATVLTKLDGLPEGVLLWRSILQWIGGVGIVLMAIILLPFLRVGGMQLFRTESSVQAEKIVSRSFTLITNIIWLYVALTLICAIAYAFLGMSRFDAICHAMTTVATAGFSTHDASIGYFNSPGIEWTAITFMLLGALPFVMYIRALQGDVRAPLRDSQVWVFLAFVSLTALSVALWLSHNQERAFFDALRASMFHVTSIITGTGYAAENYGAWGEGALGIFLLLTFVGGCAGSTTGGIKIYRLQIAWKIGRTHLMHLVSPHRVVVPSYNGHRLPADVPFSVLSFLAIYLITVGLVTVALTAIGLDFVTALSSSATAVSNVGPGLGETVGPDGNFSALPQTAKWILSLAMLLGRLELFTVIVVLHPDFWKR
ncbi:MAG: TrkH family potassium uptake protein [Pseudomonadota bacterium]